jgi:hypothetical protein
VLSACDGTAGARVDITPTVAGRVYYILVSGFSDSDFGQFRLNVQPIVANAFDFPAYYPPISNGVLTALTVTAGAAPVSDVTVTPTADVTGALLFLPPSVGGASALVTFIRVLFSLRAQFHDQYASLHTTVDVYGCGAFNSYDIRRRHGTCSHYSADVTNGFLRRQWHRRCYVADAVFVVI